MAVHILDFKAQRPSEMPVWKQFSRPCVWKSPHPEFILSTQSPQPGDSVHLQTNAASTAMLVAEVAPDDPLSQERLQGVPPSYDDGNSPSGLAKRLPSKQFPPVIHGIMNNPMTCNHARCRRYRNIHGRFAECLECKTKWKWNEDNKMWVEHGRPGRSLRSQPLPLPSSSNTISSTPYPKSQMSSALAKAKPKSRPRRPPPAHNIKQWMGPIFSAMDLMLDHLTVEQKQRSVPDHTNRCRPLEMEPTNMAEFAFLNEEIHRESREEMERQQDQERWGQADRLGESFWLRTTKSTIGNSWSNQTWQCEETAW